MLQNPIIKVLTAKEIHIEKLIENRKARNKLLNRCEEDVKNIPLIYNLCKRHPEKFFEFFVFTSKNHTFITDPRLGVNIPMLLFDYQKEYLEDLWSAIQMSRLPAEDRTAPTSVFSEKSRQMGFSRFYAGFQVYAYIFHDMKSLYVSRKEKEVDTKGDIGSHFEKMRYILRHLPSWMLPEGVEKEGGTDHNKSMLLSKKDGVGIIKGETANPDAGRGGTYDFVILDEMAHMEYAQAINMSVSAATSVRIFNGTPNGEGNEYFKMRKMALAGNLLGHTCKRDCHPFYDQAWYDNYGLGKTREQIAQEMELDYNVALTGRVYKDFKASSEIYEYREDLPLYAFLDNSHGGTDPHAVVLCQTEGHYLNIIGACEFGDGTSPKVMAAVMGKNPKDISMSNIQLDFYEKYRNMKNPLYISDPNDTNSTVGDNTILGYYSDENIFLNVPPRKGLDIQIMKTKENIHRVRVGENCADFVSAMQNARYKEVKDGSARTTKSTKPLHDWTSHYRTALEYGINWLLVNKFDEEKQKLAQPKKVLRQFICPITGDVSYKLV